MSEALRIRKWEKLDFHNPKDVLLKLREIEVQVANSNTPYKIAALRTNKLQSSLEGRQAALFCQGLSEHFGSTVFFSMTEDEDYDFVTCWQRGSERIFTPVQLKELVPEKVNFSETLPTLITKLEKYTDSKDLVVAIHINRAGKFDTSEIDTSNLPIAELYFFGAIAEDKSQWFVFGGKCGQFESWNFEYPET